jgi:hypothetical protein
MITFERVGNSILQTQVKIFSHRHRTTNTGIIVPDLNVSRIDPNTGSIFTVEIDHVVTGTSRSIGAEITCLQESIGNLSFPEQVVEVWLILAMLLIVAQITNATTEPPTIRKPVLQVRSTAIKSFMSKEIATDFGS